MSQAGIINVIDNNPTIPIYFEGDTGFAVALFNTIIFAGAGGIVTSATGNTVTIDGSGITFDLTLTGDTGGPLSPTADNFNIVGGSGAAGTTPVQVNGAVSTLTVNVQKAQAIAATNATNVGLAAFDSASFGVDANGFVTLSGAALGVLSVSGTLNRITSTGGQNPVIDIDAAYVGQTSITTLGTVTTGVWNGTAVTETFGGTGQTTYATGDILYASAANTLSKLAATTNGFVLTLTGGVPVWAAAAAGTVTSVSGTLNRITSTGGATPVIDIAATYVGQTSITTLGTIVTGVWNGSTVTEGFGGTNQTTYATGDILYASGANTLAKRAIGATGDVLTVAGGVPTWAAPTVSSKITIYNTADSPATWTKDARTLSVEVYGWAGGGGAGSGRKGTSTAAGGGGGGGAGGTFYFQGAASVFNATESVVIGAGGTGGAAQTTNATNGNPGVSAGGNTSFGNMLCLGGGVGTGGTTTNAGGGTTGLVIFPYGTTTGVVPGVGRNGATSSTGASWGPGQTSNQSISPGGGGGGAGADTVTQRVGGTGCSLVNVSGTIILSGGAGGLESTGINGGNGNAFTTGGIFCGGSGGGGGGGYSVGAGGATAGGNGGNGAIPGGGGGGGGGGIDAVANSGSGGNGANGRVVVIEYF